MAPAAGHRRGEEVQPARPRRRRASPPASSGASSPRTAPSPSTWRSTRDESEPGTFKDRYILENDPHMMLEGIAIAVLRARRAHLLHLHPRRVQVPGGAHPGGHRRGVQGRHLRQEDAGQGLRAGLLPGARRGRVHLRRGDGAARVLEGKKGWPRLKPPFPAVVGLFGCPTVVNNVETLATRARHLREGRGLVRRSWAPDKSGGTRLVCLSGTVNRPGRLRDARSRPPSRELIFDAEVRPGACPRAAR